MYIRNFDPHPSINVTFEGLRKDGGYWFPRGCKFLTWAIVIMIIATSCCYLLYFGEFFGMYKAYLWLTAFSASFLISVLLVWPIWMTIFNFLDTILFKGVPYVVKKKIQIADLSNLQDQEKKEEILKYRKYNANLYSPTPLYKLQSRLDVIKYNIELRNLAVDILAHAVFMVTVFYIVLVSRTKMAFQSQEAVMDLVIWGNFTHTISFKQAYTHDALINYLNETFFPAVLVSSDGGSSGNSAGILTKLKSHKTRPYTFHSVNSARKIEILNKLNHFGLPSNILEKGWTSNHNLKLLGKPRLRQVRVKPGTCKELENVEARDIECSVNLNLLNVDTDSYSLNWKPKFPKGLTEMEAAPWRYASAYETATMPIFGKLAIYPGGGYILNLARHIDDARIILDFMNVFEWIDIRTRAIFVEFTLYCVNTNLFNVVTLMVEKSAIGYIAPSYQIDTIKFIFLENEVVIMTVIMSVLCAFLLLFFLLRESLRIHRTSFKIYMCSGFAVLDLLIIILGAFSLICLIFRGVYVRKLIKRLEISNNNDFVSFLYAAFWHSWSVYCEAILICMAAVKFFRLLNFKVVFFRFFTALSNCYRQFIDLALQLAILIIAFGFFFYLLLINLTERFSNFTATFCTMLARAFAIEDAFDYSVFNRSSWYLAPFFYLLFVFLVSSVFVNLFTSVVCLYYHSIRIVPITNRYHLWDYIKYAFTRRKHRDILPLKDAPPEETPDNIDPTIMRLKGGGNKQTKSKTKAKKRKKSTKSFVLKKLGKAVKAKVIKAKKLNKLKKIKKMKEKLIFRAKNFEMQEIMVKDFVTRKPFSLIRYMGLDQLRGATMRNLLASYYADDKELKNALRMDALRGVYISLMTKPKKVESSGNYFLVAGSHGSEVHDIRTFFRMRKVVEDFGRKRRWFVEEEVDKEIDQWEKKLAVLNEKFSLLLQKK